MRGDSYGDRPGALLRDGAGPGLARLRNSAQAEQIRLRVLQQQQDAVKGVREQRARIEGALRMSKEPTPTPALDPQVTKSTGEKPVDTATATASASAEGEQEEQAAKASAPEEENTNVAKGKKKGKFSGKRKAKKAARKTTKKPSSGKRAALLAKTIKVGKDYENPKKSGAKFHDGFAKLGRADGKTVGDFVKSGGSIAVVSGAVRRKLITLS